MNSIFLFIHGLYNQNNCELKDIFQHQKQAEEKKNVSNVGKKHYLFVTIASILTASRIFFILIQTFHLIELLYSVSLMMKEKTVLENIIQKELERNIKNCQFWENDIL